MKRYAIASLGGLVVLIGAGVTATLTLADAQNPPEPRPITAEVQPETAQIPTLQPVAQIASGDEQLQLPLPDRPEKAQAPQPQPVAQSTSSRDGPPLPVPDKQEIRHPNLGSHLDRMVADVEDGSTSPQDALEGAEMHLGESVAVSIYLSGNVSQLVKFLEDNGGDPRNVGEDYIEAYVPVPLLGDLSEQPGVLRVREIIPPEAAPVPVPSTVKGGAADIQVGEEMGLR